MHDTMYGEAVPAPHQLLAELNHLAATQGHITATHAGRLALCAMALGIVVRVAAKMPHGCRERRALARAAAELRQAV